MLLSSEATEMFCHTTLKRHEDDQITEFKFFD